MGINTPHYLLRGVENMNKLELLSESRTLQLAIVLLGIVLGLSVFAAGSADPWSPWPWV
jgi:hypothetical protein